MTAKPKSSKKRASSSVSSVPFVVIEKVIFGAAGFGDVARFQRRRPQRLPVDQRLPAEERQIEARARLRVADQQVDGVERGGQRHVLRRRPELALLGVTVRAAEIALLGDRQRQGSDPRRLERRVVDQRRPAEARLLQQPLDLVAVAPRHRGAVAREKLRLGVEQPAAVGDKEMEAESAFDQVGLGRPGRRGAHVAPCFSEAQTFLPVAPGPGESSASRPPIWNFIDFSQSLNSSSYMMRRESA